MGREAASCLGGLWVMWGSLLGGPLSGAAAPLQAQGQGLVGKANF